MNFVHHAAYPCYRAYVEFGDTIVCMRTTTIVSVIIIITIVHHLIPATAVVNTDHATATAETFDLSIAIHQSTQQHLEAASTSASTFTQAPNTVDHLTPSPEWGV